MIAEENTANAMQCLSGGRQARAQRHAAGSERRSCTPLQGGSIGVAARSNRSARHQHARGHLIVARRGGSCARWCCAVVNPRKLPAAVSACPSCEQPLEQRHRPFIGRSARRSVQVCRHGAWPQSPAAAHGVDDLCWSHRCCSASQALAASSTPAASGTPPGTVRMQWCSGGRGTRGRGDVRRALCNHAAAVRTKSRAMTST